MAHVQRRRSAAQALALSVGRSEGFRVLAERPFYPDDPVYPA
jgi:hypothetical protein